MIKKIIGYFKFVPIIVYPYAYAIWLIILIAALKRAGDTPDIEHAGKAFLISFIIFQVITLCFSVWSTVSLRAAKVSLEEACITNLALKVFHIPAILTLMTIGFFGIMLSVWGIGLILLSMIISALSLLLTGVVSIVPISRIRREGLIKTDLAVIFGVCSFIPIADLLAAFACFAITSDSKWNWTKKIKQKLGIRNKNYYYSHK